MSYPITHMTVRDVLPENKTIVIGQIYPITPTVEDRSGLAFVHDDDRRGHRLTPEELAESQDADDTEAPEAKVVKRGRRPVGPRVAEVAETK